MSDFFSELNKVSFYTAPSTHSPTPFQISAGLQVVEIITSGDVYFEINSLKRPFRRGTIFWHIAGDHTICETTREDPYRCLVLVFKCQEDRRVVPRVSFWRGSDASLEEFSLTVYNTVLENQNSAEALAMLCRYCASNLLMHANKLIPLHPKAPVPQDSSSDQMLMRSVLNYIGGNLAEDLSINTLSTVLKLPRNRIFALFQEHLQQTPHGYILEKRLQHARSLLESSSVAIKEVAAACGFEHVEVFHRCFVKHFNETPKAYRHNHSPYRNLSVK